MNEFYTHIVGTMLDIDLNNSVNLTSDIKELLNRLENINDLCSKCDEFLCSRRKLPE